MAFLMEVMVTLTQTDIEEDDCDPYDGEDRPSGPLDSSVGAKGLGTAGCVPGPQHLWERFARPLWDGRLVCCLTKDSLRTPVCRRWHSES